MQNHKTIKTNSNADTAQHCTWVTQTKLIQTEQVFEPWPGWNCFPCNFKTLGGNTFFSVEDQGGSDALMIIATNDTAAYLGGAEVDLDVTPNVASELRIPVGDITAGSFIAVVSEMVNGEPVELASNELVSGTLKKLSFTPTQSEVQLKFVNTSSGSGGLSLFTVDFAVLMPTAVNVLVRVCDESEDWRFGFNGYEKDNEIKGIGNSLSFKHRIEDTRLGRFFSPDPLHRQYPWNSDYAFAENSPISGIDLEGLEYLGHNEARVEFKYGQLRLKVENFHTVNRNRWNNANNDPKNWRQGEIGLNSSLANIGFIAPQPMTPSASDISEVGAAKPIERYKSNIASNKYDQRPGIVGPAGRGRSFSKSIVVVDAINQALDSYIRWAGKDDADLVNKHSIIATKVRNDVNKAIDKGMIPNRYMNKEGITNIMNVVLQGENNTKDPGIYETGMKIYDMSNPKKTEYVPSGLDNFPGRTIPVSQPATGK